VRPDLCVMSPESFIQKIEEDALRRFAATGIPLVTLSYAQSLDGSISRRRGEPLALSGRESLLVTHRLRGIHDAILVGIGTVLADDPQLTVRNAPGTHPVPVVLDTRLRIPSGARLWSHPVPPWLFTGPDPAPGRRTAFEARGARIFSNPPGPGGQIDLAAMLRTLGSLGVRSLMVEGGAEVITNFLRANLVDRAAVTISPRFVGGLRALEARMPGMPQLIAVEVFQLGDDIVITGAFPREV
jgi:riboflavin-specific deaminase-like protein